MWLMLWWMFWSIPLWLVLENLHLKTGTWLGCQVQYIHANTWRKCEWCVIQSHVVHVPYCKLYHEPQYLSVWSVLHLQYLLKGVAKHHVPQGLEEMFISGMEVKFRTIWYMLLWNSPPFPPSPSPLLLPWRETKNLSSNCWTLQIYSKITARSFPDSWLSHFWSIRITVTEEKCKLLFFCTVLQWPEHNMIMINWNSTCWSLQNLLSKFIANPVGYGILYTLWESSSFLVISTSLVCVQCEDMTRLICSKCNKETDIIR